MPFQPWMSAADRGRSDVGCCDWSGAASATANRPAVSICIRTQGNVVIDRSSLRLDFDGKAFAECTGEVGGVNAAAASAYPWHMSTTRAFVVLLAFAAACGTASAPVVVASRTMASDVAPPAPPAQWLGLIGEYGPDGNTHL